MHKATLAPDLDILQGHQALNAHRDLPPAEQWGLAHLQQQYGREALLRWQLRAASAGRTDISLNYYRACAADEALSAVKPQRGCGPSRAARAESRTSDPPAEPVAHAAPRPAPRPAPQPLDPERARLVAAIAQRLGAAVLCPHKLANTPLEVLERWQAIADHPGLRKMADPVGLFVQRASAGKAPPAPQVLDAWAREIADESSATALASSAPDLVMVAQLYAALDELLPSSCYPMLAQVRMQVSAGAISLVCPNLAVFNVAWDVQEVIRDALRDLDWAGDLRILAPPIVRPPDPALLPPSWIDPPTWAALHPDLQAALVGSVLLPDGLDVCEAQYAVLTTRFVAEVRALIANAHGADRSGQPIPQPAESSSRASSVCSVGHVSAEQSHRQRPRAAP